MLPIVIKGCASSQEPSREEEQATLPRRLGALAQRGLDLAAAIGVAIVLSRLGGQLGQRRQIGNPTRQRCCRGRDLLQDRLDLMETVSLVDHRVDVTTSAMPGALPPSKKPESTFRPCR